MTKDLKKDFNNRINDLNEINLFSTFSGEKYTVEQIKYYFFNLKKKIVKNKIIFFCDTSIESHIISMFLILSEYDVYFINNINTKIDELCISATIITVSEIQYKQLKNIYPKFDLIFASPIDEFVKWSHPSIDIKKYSERYKNLQKVGKSIFLSSGSTGEPKIIPLNYDQINACYRNVCNGFLKNLKFETIVSIHDTSFVIILPFLFCLASNSKSNLLASDSRFSSKPILQLSAYIKNLDNFIIISVPSVFRLIFKLLKESFNSLSKGNIIACGEPLDKKLALKIINNKPKSFLNLYGSTEVAPWILQLDVLDYFKSFKVIKDIPSILPAGKALPDVLLNISKSSELLVSSKSVFDGYYERNNSDIFSHIQNQKFFKTGDQFEIRNNYFFCKGRINSSVKMAGIFVNPILLEIEIKDKLNLQNILVIPDTINLYLSIIIFKDDCLKLNDSFAECLKKLVSSKISKNIPIKIVADNSEISYLKSGKINRSFYKNKYLSN